MIYELRQYRTLPGKRDEWVRFMNEVIIPGQTAAGATIHATFVGNEEDDLYVWIRSFPSEEARQAFQTDYYGTDEWINVLRPQTRTMIDGNRIVVTTLDAAEGSPLT
jgi:hypothetical protein